MMKLFPRIYAVVLIVVGATALCHAQTAYVSDILILTFRQGPGPGYPVISTLKSDTPLTVIEEKNGYLKVELSSGEQGWVDKNYIVTDPPKSILIDRLKKENAVLEDKIRILTEQAGQSPSGTARMDTDQNTDMAANQAAMEQLKKENQALTQDLETLKSQYTVLKTASGNVTVILEENKRLKTRNASLSATLAQQEANDGFVFRTDMIKWFLAGVGVLLLGWVIGLSISSRRGSSGSLLD
ncbi:TIGR04211 family SH3 domain-containing protein [Desulfobacter vibrioformis]|uniref:TIGR04211 family SH3 domain-containing protein n=1 Tax=Desulfobacter vibrioformis TaxID=34031 RepID=UPI00054ECF1E|nr:TIGR04211 family SH3 domain-containing protein [Desulfobacter vibrioformis]